jgi:ABC-type transporter Mla subunit MlaD
MKRGSPLQALASSPTMVGAITTLIVIVAVFLAYNANNGLPFVPTYRVSVEIPNASRLVRNNEVRIGGNRVGVIESIEAVHPEPADNAQGSSTDAGGASAAPQVVARLDLKLDKSAEPLPENSVFRVRYKSSFGLKYLEITRGDGPPAPEGFVFNGIDDNDDPNDDDAQILSLDEVDQNQGADNGTFIDQTEFDDIGNTFDQRTRNAGRQNLLGYGDALAGRGGSLNLAIESLKPLLSNLKPVATTLAAADTRFERFFPELADAARIVAPVADQNAELFTNMAVTFGAISADPEALKETISEGPPTLETGIRVLPAQTRFLAEFTDLSQRLKPGVRQLRLALPDLNDAISTGTPVLERTPRMNRDLRGVFLELENLVEDPSTKASLTRLEDTFDKADPLASAVVPTQTVCNYWNYWFTYLTEHLSERDSVGYTQRVSLIDTPPGPLTVDIGGVPVTIPGEVETGISTAGYSGLQANGKAYTPDGSGEFEPTKNPILHANPVGPTGQNGSDCQTGQVGYLQGSLRLPGQAASNPAVAVPDIPGDRGPTTEFFKQNGDRIQVDSRVASRQPGQ